MFFLLLKLIHKHNVIQWPAAYLTLPFTFMLKNVLLPIILIGCSPKQPAELQVMLKTEFKLPSSLKEVSGIALSQDGQTIYAIEDQGNKNILYHLDLNGKILAETPVEAGRSADWEDVVTDRHGQLYIGDTGNNDNERKDLGILKVDAQSGEILQKTSFSYPEQQAFPPKKSQMWYDCEGFVVYDGNFYLFTKNRSKHFDGTFFVYKVPNLAGDFKAQKVGTLRLTGDYSEAAITSAAINEAEDRIVLLAHRNIHVLEGFSKDDFSKTRIKNISLGHNSQKESIVFRNAQSLLIADERAGKDGGYLYSLKLTQ